MERRKTSTIKPTPLPVDYLRMVSTVFTTNFDAPLKAFAKLKEQPVRFEASGNVYGDKIVLCVSLHTAGELAATSVYASSDFDPKASSPTVQDLLGACVDGLELFSGSSSRWIKRSS